MKTLVKNDNRSTLGSYDSLDLRVKDLVKNDNIICTLYENGRIICEENGHITRTINIDPIETPVFGFVNGSKDITVFKYGNGILTTINILSNTSFVYKFPDKRMELKDNSVKFFNGGIYALAKNDIFPFTIHGYQSNSIEDDFNYSKSGSIHSLIPSIVEKNEWISEEPGAPPLQPPPPPSYYKVNFSATNGTLVATINGSRIVSGSNIKRDDIILFQAEAGYDYQGGVWTIDGRVTNVTDNSFVTTVDRTINISVIFQPIPYDMSVSSIQPFESVRIPYTANDIKPPSQTVTIENLDIGVLYLLPPVSSAFTCSQLTNTILNKGEKSTFTITPKTGLTAGIRNENITVQGSNSLGTNSITRRVTATIEILPEALYTLSITPNNGTVTFEDQRLINGVYTIPAAQTVTVKNVGNMLMTFAQPTATNYTISNLSKTTIVPNEELSFTVRPKSDLVPSNYDESISLVSNSVVRGSVNVKFSVLPEAIYSLNLSTVGIVFEDSRLEGGSYQPPTAQGVFITNTGNVPIRLTQPTSTNFTISNLPKETIAVGETISISVQPKNILQMGSYNETINIISNGIVYGSFTVAFTVLPEAIYMVQVTPSSLGFGNIQLANNTYTPPAAQTVTIKNTGNIPIILDQPVATSYNIGNLSKTRIEANEEATFTVQPKSGLSINTYNETINIISDGTTRGSVNATFIVSPGYSYSISLDPATLDFSSLDPGYTQPSLKSVDIKNTGTGPVTINKITTPANYTMTGSITSSNQTIQSGGKITLQIRPLASLASGTYDTTINITGDNGVSATLTVQFTVYTMRKISFSSDSNGTLSATVDGNSISTNTNVRVGKVVKFTASANTGYDINAWTGSGLSGTATSTTRDLTVGASDQTVSVSFKKKTYTVTITQPSNGSISATKNGTTISTGATVEHGDKLIFTATPAAGYRFSSWSSPVGSTSDNVQTINSVSGNVTISCSIVAIPQRSVQWSVTNGTITVFDNDSGATIANAASSGNIQVQEGKTIKMKATKGTDCYDGATWNGTFGNNVTNDEWVAYIGEGSINVSVAYSAIFREYVGDFVATATTSHTVLKQTANIVTQGQRVNDIGVTVVKTSSNQCTVNMGALNIDGVYLPATSVTGVSYDANNGNLQRSAFVISGLSTNVSVDTPAGAKKGTLSQITATIQSGSYLRDKHLYLKLILKPKVAFGGVIGTVEKDCYFDYNGY